MSPADQTWVGQTVFSSQSTFTTPLQHWYYPPNVSKSGKPVPGQYFLRRFFLWMPRKMYAYDFKCIKCDKSLRSKGVYNRVRLVLDLKDYYYLAAEYMDCNGCTTPNTYIAWDARILDQLPYPLRLKFPAILTYKYACDYSVISLLRSRTLGNSPTALQNNLQELHSECWLRRHAEYLRDCIQHATGLSSMRLPPQKYEAADEFKVVPSPKWFLACYSRDVWTRLESLKASVTSVFGQILKIDGTKKICRKLAGEVANSANFALNVGNERGEILQSVMTSSEAVTSLQPLADGLVNRYSAANVDPPVLLYTDRDCCSESGPSKFQVLFGAWESLQIHLDIWHFMRRLAVGCSSESHPLYGVFMSRISGCIFEWDKDDYANLLKAKRGELVAAGVKDPSDVAVRQAVSAPELARHCKRRTRGEENTTKAIEDLILSLTSATDTLGVPLFNDEIVSIWEEQKKHIKCIQDIPDIPLYAVTNEVSKGGQKLPVYRCARGTTSLESYHRHLVTFVPGTSANAVNFQAYLLDGITRWNAARSQAALHSSNTEIRCFDVKLVTKFDSLHKQVHGKALLSVDLPNKYSGEKIGLEYLYEQSGMTLGTGDLDTQVDELDDDSGLEEDSVQVLEGDLMDSSLQGAVKGISDHDDDGDDDNDNDDDNLITEEGEKVSITLGKYVCSL